MSESSEPISREVSSVEPSTETEAAALTAAGVAHDQANLGEHDDAESAAESDRQTTIGPLLRRRRVRRWMAYALIGGGAVAAALLISGVVLAGRRPSWYQPMDPRDPLVVASARRIENAVATALTRIRTTPAAPGASNANAPSTDMFTLALSATDANAWLSARLPGWLAHECDPPMDWPPEVSGVRVGFDSGRIHMGAGLGEGQESPRVLTASVRPQFADDGALWTPATSLGIGRLSMPAGLVLRGAGWENGGPEQMPASVAEMSQTRDVIAALKGDRPTLSKPIIRIGDGRRIRLVAIESRAGKLYLTCQPLPNQR